MNYIYVRKSEILKKEIVENIKINLFNRKKAIEEGLSKAISPNGNILVKYEDKKYIYNIKVNRLFPDLKNYNFTSLNLGEKSVQDIKNIFSEEFKNFEEIEILSEEIYRKVFYRENNRYIEEGKILNVNNIIENYIIEKNGNLLIFNSQAEEIENKEATVIPVIKILDIGDNNDSKKELEVIIKSFKENEIEISFDNIDKRYKEKYDELVELYNDIEKYDFSEDNSDYDEIEILKSFENGELELPLNFIDEYLQKLKNIEKTRLNEKEYDDKIFTDYQKGNWDIFSDSEEDIEKRELIKIATDEKYYAKNPKDDIREGGVVAIDFGTKSTVVAIQTQNEKTSLVRIAGDSYKRNVETSQFENPTIMEFVDIKSFEKAYSESKGRPFTEWNDLKISYAANSSFLGGSKFILEGLKQWAGNKDEKLIIYDKKGKRIDLKPYIDVKEDEFDPIEYYAYYIGSYINNMFTANIFTKYLLSFPIKYEKEIREKILKSFEKGIKKSLPISIIENKEIMKNFQVYRGANEPTAYFLCAGRELEKFPKKENEKLFYGIFDFGGGTTDFSFGICRYIGLTTSRYDYEIKHFGEGGDKFLGGENILKELAYKVFTDNSSNLRKTQIQYTRPEWCDEIVGEETLVSQTKQARQNSTKVAKELRGIWENTTTERVDYISVNLFNSFGEINAGFKLDIKEDELKNLIKDKIEKGIKNFFIKMEDAFKGEDVKEVNIFLAGNSCKHPFVEETFNRYIEEKKDKLKINIHNTKMFEKLKETNKVNPTAKTGVAFGLIYSRNSGRIKVISRDEKANVSNEVNFKFYVGNNRRNKFNCIISPNSSYDEYKFFGIVKSDIFELYYSTSPEAQTNEMKSSEAKIKRVNLKKEYEEEDRYRIYLKANKSDELSYAIVKEEKGIETKKFVEEGEISLN